ncbi:hypothetical protein [Calothrix sp. NIES-2100]|uniref:hypothetical protein n=1 Tax=Calothrix sp. NIES-2100 TaxID=1954172 RepID=UPI000BBC1266
MSQAEAKGIEKNRVKYNSVFVFHPDVYLGYEKAKKININYEFWKINFKTNGVYHLPYNVASIADLK